MKGFLKNTLSNVSIRMLAIVTNLLLVPILISSLGTVHYGLLILGNSIIGNFAFMDTGLTSGVTRFVAKYQSQGDHKGMRAVLDSSTMIYLLIALVNGLVLLAVYFTGFYSIFNVAEGDIQMFGKLILVAVASAPVHWLTKVYMGALFGLKLHYKNNIAKLATMLLSPFGVILLAYLQVGVLWIFCFQQAMFMAMLIAQALFVYVKTAWVPRFAIDKGILKEIYSFSAWVFLSKISSQVILQLDVILISIYIGPSALVLYNIFNVLFTNLTKISDITLSALIPYLVGVYEKGGMAKLQAYGYQIGKLLNMLNTFIFFFGVLFIDAFLSLWVGGDYLSQSWLLKGIFLVVFIYKSNAIVFHLSSSTGNIKAFSLISIIAAALNVPLVIYFIGVFDGPGAILATAIVNLLSFVAFYFIVFPKLGMSVGKYIRESFLAAIWPNALVFVGLYVGLGQWLSNSIHSWGMLISCVAVAAMTMAVVSYLFVLGPAEKKLIARMVGVGQKKQ